MSFVAVCDLHQTV
uniref:Uncharacterized protein n=1 Tax=Anguilla anguilla TaxID=7936 RepID=A0A0E9TGJ1_ANGAN